MGCLLPFILVTDPGVAGDLLLEMTALAGVALILAGGLLCRSSWARPATALTILVLFLNNYADKFWPFALIMLIGQVIVPVCYLYFSRAVKAYFRLQPGKTQA
jgi:hypothetical protein